MVTVPAAPPLRPVLADQPSLFVSLERAVEDEFRPQMLAALQRKVDAVAEGEAKKEGPPCPVCEQPMPRHDAPMVSWVALFGQLQVQVTRYRCRGCSQQCRPLLDLLGVEPGHISGSLARLLAVLAVVAPYTVGARMAWLLLRARVNP